MHVFVCVHRYLDDVSLHHLINALCSLSLEAMEMASGNNKVENHVLYFILKVLSLSFLNWYEPGLFSKSLRVKLFLYI